MVKDELIHRAREAHKQGELAAAEELYRQVLSGNPGDSDANHLLGVICYQRGEYDTALELIRKAVAVRSEHAATYNNLGNVQKALGIHSEALESFKKAIALQPDLAEAHNNLGTVYKELGELENAEKAYNEALRCQPEYIKALNNLGNLFLERREFVSALDMYGQALSIAPDYPLSQYNLGCALTKLGRFAEAEAALINATRKDCEMVEAFNALGRLYTFRFQFGLAIYAFQKSIALHPDAVEGYIGLGNTYLHMNRFGLAAEYLERAAAMKPESAEVLSNLGMVYNFQGKPDKANQCLDKANQLSPDDVGIICSLASLYTAKGMFSESITTCNKALAVRPDCATAYFQLAMLTDGREHGEIIDAITLIIDHGQKIPQQEMQLQFGLAKLFEDQGQYDQSFVSLSRANQLKRKTFSYSLDPFRTLAKKICKVYDKETLRRSIGNGCASDIPIFIVGLPRCGSTLVEQILASHPYVYGGGELPHLIETVSEYFQLVCQDETIPASLNLQPEDLVQLGSRYVEKLQPCSPAAKRITDKMLANFMQLGLISVMLPRAKIIHCQRDPRDSCLSMYKKLFTRGHQYAYDLKDLGEYYLLYRKVMAHWREVLLGGFLDFCYEDLVQDQEGETRRLLEYCELDWHEGCMRFYDCKRAVNTASQVQVRKPMTGRSVGLWKRYEKELQPLLTVLKPCL